MPIPVPRRLRRAWSALFSVALLALAPAASSAQVPVQVRPGQPLPNPDQARDMLRNQPDMVRQLRDKLKQSGMSDDQVRARLRAAGYPEDFLDQYLSGADTSLATRPGPRTIDAVTAVGILSPQEADSLQAADSMYAVSDSVRRLLDSLRFRHLDSLRADSLADSLEVVQPSALKIFGLETFRHYSTQFDAMDDGPVDASYRLGPGDVLVLILTGDVEQAHMLEVTREGFVVIPQVGQLQVANLTMGQLEDQLYTRLGRVYSGVRRSPNARTKFQLSLAKLRKIQVYVAGDVVRPGAYQVSAAGTVLNAIYAAGGPTSNGSFRRIDIRRGGELVDSVDVYQYLTQGINPTGARLQPGDVVFIPVHGPLAKVAGKVSRPAIYELRPDETSARPAELRRRLRPDRLSGTGHHPPGAAAVGSRDRWPGAGGRRGRRRPVRERRGARGSHGRRRLGHRPRRRRPAAGFRDRAGQRVARGRSRPHAGHEAERRHPAGRRAQARRLSRPDPGDPGARRLQHGPAPLRLPRQHRRGGERHTPGRRGRDPDLLPLHLPHGALRGRGGRGARSRAGCPGARG